MAPEAIDHSKVEVSARYYRAFVDAAWSAFGATGHGHDTILIGEVLPIGSNGTRATSTTRAPRSTDVCLCGRP